MSITASQRNLEHALDDNCSDPDCEIHQPDVIEDEQERWTAKAWFYAGAMSFMRSLDNEMNWRGTYNSDAIAAAIVSLRDVYVLHRNWP